MMPTGLVPGLVFVFFWLFIFKTIYIFLNSYNLVISLGVHFPHDHAHNVFCGMCYVLLVNPQLLILLFYKGNFWRKSLLLQISFWLRDDKIKTRKPGPQQKFQASSFFEFTFTKGKNEAINSQSGLPGSTLTASQLPPFFLIGKQRRLSKAPREVPLQWH